MFEIQVSRELDGWVEKLERLGRLTPARMAWTRATKSMYDRSQQVVHVITGELKRSGSYQVRLDGDEVVGEVVYTAKQAVFEEALGGEHAFLSRAAEDTQDVFDDAMMAGWREVFGR